MQGNIASMFGDGPTPSISFLRHIHTPIEQETRQSRLNASRGSNKSHHTPEEPPQSAREAKARGASFLQETLLGASRKSPGLTRKMEEIRFGLSRK